MNKLEHTTKSNSEALLDELYKIVPAAFTETLDSKTGEPRRAVDIDALRRLLGDDTVEGRSERYQFTWAGKREAMAEAARPINKTLRPQKEDSVDWDTTKNLYIEGDNLEVLKLLQKSYYGQVKMIYIDPPYNTGNDFVYDDDFSRSADDEALAAGDVDEYGNKLRKNTDSNGRFHSDWCSMIYPRLMLARNLLREDGVIFISIDDNEVENLRKICDELFGEGNFVAQLVWERAFAPKNDARFISNSHDYVLMFAKDINQFVIGRLPRTAEADARYSNPDNDPRGVWQSDNLTVKTYSASCDYPITTPSGRVVEPPAGRCWSLSKNAFFERLRDNRIWFGSDGNGVPRIKRFLSELKFDGMAPTSILFYKDVGHSQEGAQEVIRLFGDKGVFDGPKPVRLLQRLITLANLKDDSIVLDFFSGSATTAHALLKTNAEKEMHCKFILVQLPEEVSEKKKDQGYKNICEIGKERIRRAGAKIKSEHPDATKLDTGFRVFRVADSNFGDVRIDPSMIGQLTLDLDIYRDNIKSDRSGFDLLYGSFLSWGVPLDEDIKTENIDGEELFIVREGYLVALFGTKVTDAIMDRIAELDPQRILFRDATFSSDEEKINVYETLKQRLGWTEDDAESNIRVL